MRKKFELEFMFNVSPNMLFNYLSTPSGLSEWFADNVNVCGDKYSFFWNDVEEMARLIKIKQDMLLRFQWEEDKKFEYYFEFLIKPDELTGDVYLNITDFANIEEIDNSKMWWDNQINRLKKIIGN
jgi:uncharacterized protein YndB with AHSA1/START domain